MSGTDSPKRLNPQGKPLGARNEPGGTQWRNENRPPVHALPAATRRHALPAGASPPQLILAKECKVVIIGDMYDGRGIPAGKGDMYVSACKAGGFVE